MLNHKALKNTDFSTAMGFVSSLLRLSSLGGFTVHKIVLCLSVI